MSFFEELENKFRSAYHEINKNCPSLPVQNKELNCNSYSFITKEIKKILIECNIKGFNLTDTTNTIIYELLNRKYFKNSNHVMAVFIGYQFHKKRGNVKNNFSVGGINDNSTLIDIANHVSTW